MLSHSLVRFKQRLQPDLGAWIACAGDLLAHLSFSPQTIILRALRHEETTIRPEFPSALDLLGQALALKFGCRYRPDLLSKTRATLPGKLLTRSQRVTQLRNVYRMGDAFGADFIPDTSILVIDDILTTGTTMRAIIRAVSERLPQCRIEAFTLTRADYGSPDPETMRGDETHTAEVLKKHILAKTI